MIRSLLILTVLLALVPKANAATSLSDVIFKNLSTNFFDVDFTRTNNQIVKLKLDTSQFDTSGDTITIINVPVGSNPTIPRIPYKNGPNSYGDSALSFIDTNTVGAVELDVEDIGVTNLVSGGVVLSVPGGDGMGHLTNLANGAGFLQNDGSGVFSWGAGGGGGFWSNITHNLYPAQQEDNLFATNIHGVGTLYAVGNLNFTPDDSDTLVNGENDISTYMRGYILLDGDGTTNVWLRLSDGNGAGTALLLTQISTNTMTLFNGDALYDNPTEHIFLPWGDWTPTHQGESILLVHTFRGWSGVQKFGGPTNVLTQDLWVLTNGILQAVIATNQTRIFAPSTKPLIISDPGSVDQVFIDAHFPDIGFESGGQTATIGYIPGSLGVVLPSATDLTVSTGGIDIFRISEFGTTYIGPGASANWAVNGFPPDGNEVIISSHDPNVAGPAKSSTIQFSDWSIGYTNEAGLAMGTDLYNFISPTVFWGAEVDDAGGNLDRLNIQLTADPTIPTWRLSRIGNTIWSAQPFKASADTNTWPYLFDTLQTVGIPGLAVFKNHGTTEFTIAANSGWDGSGTKFFANDGTFKTASGGGSGSTNWVDSAGTNSTLAGVESAWSAVANYMIYPQTDPALLPLLNFGGGTNAIYTDTNTLALTIPGQIDTNFNSVLFHIGPPGNGGSQPSPLNPAFDLTYGNLAEFVSINTTALALMSQNSLFDNPTLEIVAGSDAPGFNPAGSSISIRTAGTNNVSYAKGLSIGFGTSGTGIVTNTTLLTLQSPTATIATNIAIDIQDQTATGSAFAIRTGLGRISFGDVVSSVGVTDASSAISGNVGEFVSSLVASGSAVTLTNASAWNVTSISLTAGDWDVEGNINFSATTATVTGTQGGISTTSATLPTDGSEVYSGVQVTLLSEKDSVTLPRKRVNVSTTTVVYLVAKSTFSAGSVTGFGSISARRVR